MTPLERINANPLPFAGLLGIEFLSAGPDAIEGLSASSSAKGGPGLAGLGGFAKVGFLVLPEVVHVEVTVGFEPVLVGFDG